MSRVAKRTDSDPGLWQDGLVRPVEGGTTNPLPACRAPGPAGSGPSAGLLFPISPQSDQEPAALAVVQRKLLDGCGPHLIEIDRGIAPTSGQSMRPSELPEKVPAISAPRAVE
jgi:hypothetical protein